MIRLFGALVLFLFALWPHHCQKAEAAEVELSRGSNLLPWFEDGEMNFQLLRSIGADGAGGGAPGEILIAVKATEEGNPASWAAAFFALAERVEADGDGRLARGHKVSAMESFLRASSYYRAAEYYGDPASPETTRRGMKCREAFLKGMELTPWKTEAVSVPFGGDGDFLPAYFISPAGGGEGGKTLLAQSGYDGTAEEMYFAVGKAALERGYNVLLFEGPGQTGKRRFHPNSVFVPDTAPALRAIMDYVLGRPEVHPEKVALYGASFGGYFAIAGAVGEERLGALIANSPVFDLREYFFAVLGEHTVSMFQSHDLTLEEVRAVPEEDLSALNRLSLVNMCVRFGKASVKGTLDALDDFRLREEQLQSLKMAALGMVSETEGKIPVAQARRFAELVPRSDLHIFAEESGANIHCQLDNMPHSWAVALDWLDEQFR